VERNSQTTDREGKTSVRDRVIIQSISLFQRAFQFTKYNGPTNARYAAALPHHHV
jgi:hypothetical protein